LLRLEHAVEAITSERIGKCSRNDAEYRGEEIGGETDAKQSRGEIDQPKGKDRHEPQEKEIVESIFLEALAKAVEPGTSFRGEKLAERALGDDEDHHGAERGADHRGDAAEEPPDQEAAGEREHGPPW
jgi:hypothetical protein